MRDFAASAGRLRTLSIGAKLLYTSFAISALIGLVISWRLYGAVIGSEGAGAYYSGAPVVQAEKPALPADDGPVIELDDEAKKPRVMTEQISDRKLLEVTHFHVFTVPVYVLILAHLWLLARMPAWAHAAGVGAAVVTSALHVAAPWIVRDRPPWVGLMPVSGVAMLITLGLVALYPTVDMWLPRPRRAGEPSAGPAGEA